MPQLVQAMEILYDLHVGTTPVEEGSPHERPHKPLLLLAVLDLIDEGLATPDRIPWCQELRDRFAARFELVRKHNDQNTPDNPFFHLRTDGFWSPWRAAESGQQPLENTPKVGDFGRVFATLTDGFDALVAIPENRQALRRALVARYFPDHARELLQAGPADDEEATAPRAAEEAAEYGRDPAFRRKIVEIYDHQCAACGLRIRLPEAIRTFEHEEQRPLNFGNFVDATGLSALDILGKKTWSEWKALAGVEGQVEDPDLPAMRQAPMQGSGRGGAHDSALQQRCEPPHSVVETGRPPSWPEIVRTASRGRPACALARGWASTGSSGALPRGCTRVSTVPTIRSRAFGWP